MNGDQIFVFLFKYVPICGKLEEKKKRIGRKHKETPYSKPEFIIALHFHLPIWNYDETIQLEIVTRTKEKKKQQTKSKKFEPKKKEVKEKTMCTIHT